MIPEDNNSIIVFRSPFSNIHCFYFKLDGAYIFFSDVEMFDLLRPHGLSIDWDFAYIYLKNSYTVTNRTALKGLKLLQHSQALCIDNKKEEVKYLWNPLDYCNQKDDRCLEEIQYSLRNVTVSCFDAWSRIFNRGMVRLSGGLDSSLVAGIMSRLPNRPDIVCVTHYDGSPLNDERAYARLTSEYTGYALKEIKVNPGLCDFHYYENFTKMPWPFMIGTNWGSLTEESSISDKYHLGVKINGEGGDVLFGFMRNNFAAKYYYYDNGFSLKFLKVAMNSAIVSDTSLWETLIEARSGECVRARYLPEKEDKYSWGINPSLVEQIDNLVSDTLWKSSHLQAAPSKKSR